MPSPVHYSERMAMGWSCAEIYNVVADVSQYSEFMPLCKKSEVMSAPIRSPSGQPLAMVTRITAGFGFFSQVVLNDVTLVPCSSITVRLHGDSSVLSDMIVVWSFTPISEHSTDVHMDMTLCIKSALARSLARAAIDTMASITSKRFEERVEQLNGPASHARYTIAEESNQACDAKAPPLQQAPLVLVTCPS